MTEQNHKYGRLMAEVNRLNMVTEMINPTAPAWWVDVDDATRVATLYIGGAVFIVRPVAELTRAVSDMASAIRATDDDLLETVPD